jgi:hypothetical protein
MASAGWPRRGAARSPSRAPPSGGRSSRSSRGSRTTAASSSPTTRRTPATWPRSPRPDALERRRHLRVAVAGFTPDRAGLAAMGHPRPGRRSKSAPFAAGGQDAPRCLRGAGRRRPRWGTAVREPRFHPGRLPPDQLNPSVNQFKVPGRDVGPTKGPFRSL